MCLAIRFPGKTKVLYIGRGGKFQGIFLADKLPPSFLRIQDKFLDYLRKYIVGSKLGKIHLGDFEKVCMIPFRAEHSENSFAFAYKENQLIFAKAEYEVVYCSWNNSTIESGNILKTIEGHLETDHTHPHEDQETIENYLKEESKKASGQVVQKKKVKFLDRKKKNIQGDLVKVQNWHEIEREILNDEVIFSDHKQVIHGHEIKYESGMNQWQKRDVIFKKIKKLKKAEEILSERLIEVTEELAKVSSGAFEFEVTKEKPVVIGWQSSQGHKKINPDKFKIKEFKLKNISGAMGLDAQSNDHLRNGASKEHFWFHIENFTSAHLLLKTDDISHLLIEDYEAIGSLIRDFSSLEITEIPLIYSQLKHIKGAKGVQGKVLIKKPKYLRVKYRNWKEIITLLD